MGIFRCILICSCMAISFSESKQIFPGAEILDWQSYKSQFGKIYTNSLSEITHKQNFLRNVQEIKAHNAKFEEGKLTYTLGLNEYSDQDPVTFSAIMNGFVKSNESVREEDKVAVTTVRPINKLSASFDWREQNKVTPVKSQGECGSCWAFTAVAVLESQILITGRDSKTLSEQQLVDCYKRSCEGDSYPGAWKYIRSKGIQSDVDYPYKSSNGRNGRCKYSQSKVVTRVSDIGYVQEDVEQIKAALESIGPLGVAIDGSGAIQQYQSGVYKCSNPSLNHAVTLVGFGSEDGEDYWIIKNSWGANWGDEGYIKISRDPDSDCGVSKYAAYATL